MSGNKRLGKKISQFVVKNGVKIIKGFIILDGGNVGLKIKVVLSIVNGLVGPTFNDETPRLDKGLALVEGKGFNAGNGGIGDWDLRPLMLGDTSTGRKGKETKNPPVHFRWGRVQWCQVSGHTGCWWNHCP